MLSAGPSALAIQPSVNTRAVRPWTQGRSYALLAAVPFLKYSGAGIIAIAATGLIYFSYFLGNLVIMRARARGWPRVSAPVKLGRWGILVNVLALLYGGAMIVNFAWPRVASNPKPNQTGGLLTFGMSWLDGIPILWSVFLFIVIIGIIYWVIRGFGPAAQAGFGVGGRVMQALFLLITVAVLVAILIADLATALLDPRTREAR